MPIVLDEDLSSLKEKVVTMGDLAQKMLQTSMRALLERDESLIDEVNRIEEQLDRFQVEIDDMVVYLMAKHGPVAMDLRFLLMVTRINTELERIGDHSVNLCENVQLLLKEPETDKLVDLPRMADTASKMLAESLRAFQEETTEKTRDVAKADDTVDAIYDELFRELITRMIEDPSKITRGVGLLLIARSLERMADHATNIAEEVVYMVKGKDVRHRPT